MNDGSSIGDQVVGICFVNVLLPPNATVVNAYIQFTADGGTSGAASLQIKGEKTTFSEVFANTPFNISGRVKTQQSVAWTNIPAWISGEVGPNQRTPNLATLITEIIEETNWQTGNPLTFIITGTGRRRAL